MLRATTTLVALAVLSLWGAANGRADDKVIGAIWQVNYKNDKGQYVVLGHMRCTTEGKVFADGREVGTHKNTSLETIEIKITNAKEKELNGTCKATKVTKDGKVWEGVYDRADGKKIPIRMFLKAD